jgi:septal ring factor EnvC (AmiA/AmiB activator)
VIPTMLKRVVACAALTACVLGVSGCADRSDSDAKVAEVKSQAEKAAKEAEAKTLQLQKDVDAAKSDLGKSDQAKRDADGRIKTLEQEIAGLKNQVNTLQQANTGLKEKASQLQAEVKKAKKAKKDAESWEITSGKNVHNVRLEALANNRYRLGPQGLVYSGVYQFDGKTLSMVAENPGYPNLVWTLKQPGQFKMESGSYAGASMKRKPLS